MLLYKNPVELTELEVSAFPLVPVLIQYYQQIMSLERTQSGVLQRLGVSHSQLVDYSSNQYAATLVGLTLGLQTFRSDRHRFKSAPW